jgi:hypothetical protein
MDVAGYYDTFKQTVQRLPVRVLLCRRLPRPYNTSCVVAPRSTDSHGIAQCIFTLLPPHLTGNVSGAR